MEWLEIVHSAGWSTSSYVSTFFCSIIKYAPVLNDEEPVPSTALTLKHILHNTLFNYALLFMNDFSTSSSAPPQPETSRGPNPLSYSEQLVNKKLN